MAELSSNLLNNSKLTFNEDVIAKIAGKAIQNINGILSMNGNLFNDIADRFRSEDDVTKGIDVEVGDKQVALDLSIILEYGANAHTVFEQILDRLSSEIEGMTGLKVVEANVEVNDVMTKKEWQKQNKSKSQTDDSRVN